MLNISGYPEIDKADYLNIKAGKDVVLSTGEIIANKELTIAPTKPLSFAFCSDTCYKPNIISIIENVDLLYHEATFLADREDLAKKNKAFYFKTSRTNCERCFCKTIDTWSLLWQI